MTAEPTNIVRGTRCGEPCPELLSGPHSPLKCTLETDRHGQHMGDHRCNLTVDRIGKIKFSWKNRSRIKGVQVTYSSGPPVVDLHGVPASHIQPRRTSLQ